MLARYIRTLKFLKPSQVRYRLFYWARKKILDLLGPPLTAPAKATGVKLRFEPFVPTARSFDHFACRFNFLGRSKTFSGSIDWNFSDYGKLWTFNLNYFDYLIQPGMDRCTGTALLMRYIENLRHNHARMAAFPTSLRAMNWIKFLSSHRVRDRKIDNSLHAQFKFLINNIEYQFLGNHLLENGFAMLFGAYYFRDKALCRTAKRILYRQLAEQILDDGAHFELSPMYHQIMLNRVLDCYNLVTNNPWGKNHADLAGLLGFKAGVMLGWLEQISFSDGSIPLLNDSAGKIAPTTAQLKEYATRLSIGGVKKRLSACGYRKVERGSAELVIDVGPVGPDYIPAHAHADTLNFELALSGHRVIVDSGVSTYEKNDERQYQRSTEAHNTVSIDGKDSSEVWGGFRVGRRARPFDFTYEEKDDCVVISCAHDGFRWLPGRPVHRRRWIFGHGSLRISDWIEGGFADAVARLHIHPDALIETENERHESGKIQFHGVTVTWRVLSGNTRIVPSLYFPQFGTADANRCIETIFEGKTSDIELSWS